MQNGVAPKVVLLETQVQQIKVIERGRVCDLSHQQELTETALRERSPIMSLADHQLCPTFLAASSPYKALQQVNVFAVTHKLSNHFLI